MHSRAVVNFLESPVFGRRRLLPRQSPGQAPGSSARALVVCQQMLNCFSEIRTLPRALSAQPAFTQFEQLFQLGFCCATDIRANIFNRFELRIYCQAWLVSVVAQRDGTSICSLTSDFSAIMNVLCPPEQCSFTQRGILCMPLKSPVTNTVQGNSLLLV